MMTGGSESEVHNMGKKNDHSAVTLESSRLKVVQIHDRKKDFLGTAMSDKTLNTSVEITQNDFTVSILPPYEGQCLVCEGQGSGQATSVQRRPTSNTAPLKLSSSHEQQLTSQNQWCGFMEDYVFTDDVGNFAHPREESYLAVLYPHLWKILQTASANTQIL